MYLITWTGQNLSASRTLSSLNSITYLVKYFNLLTEMFYLQDQYIFLHTALTEALLLTTSAVPASQFSEIYKELLQVDHAKKKRNLDSAFEVSVFMKSFNKSITYTK